MLCHQNLLLGWSIWSPELSYLFGASSRLGDKGGVYCEDCDIARLVPADDNSPTGVRPYAIDKIATETLWRLSEKLTNLQFTL